ncbi:hemerythrin domain-containing protein [Streptomyces sp. NPDC000348]|uniref:hemerythrin domain-containing protein n=1 Tax=Streptomyces sp. NPDC000348 TaxID=3364538 RepID=UPI0036AF8688
MSSETAERRIVTEMRLLNKAQRSATALLIDAMRRGPASSRSLTELRCLVMGILRHYHDRQDAVLWPQLISADSAKMMWLIDLSAEHDALDSALDVLSTIPCHGHGDRPELVTAAVALRDLLHTHLDHEESLLLPALTTHVSDESWTELFRSMLASAPRAGAHLGLALFDEVGTPAELALITADLPQTALRSVPAMCERASNTLSSLRAAR